MEIGIWGDSITYGAGDKEGLGWAGRLRNALDSGDHDVEVYNRGICGDTSEDILKRFSVEAASIMPQKIVFTVGANDAKIPSGQESNKVPIDKYKENVSNLIKAAKSYTKDIFVVGILNVDEPSLHTNAKFTNTEIDMYNNILKDISKSEGVIFIDVFNLLVASDFYDGLHPNANGYQKMFELIEKAVK